MSRSWGLAFMVVATLIGVGALLLPVPETYQVVEIVPPKPEKKAPAPRAAPRGGKEKGPAKAPPKPAPPPPPELPTSDTTKGRLTPLKK